MTTPPDKKNTSKYTCNEYREEMILAGLQRSLQNPDLSSEERARIQKEITALEEAMGL
jgi:lipoprotein NlpI